MNDPQTIMIAYFSLSTGFLLSSFFEDKISEVELLLKLTRNALLIALLDWGGFWD